MKHRSLVQIVCAAIIAAGGVSYGANNGESGGVTLVPSGFVDLREGQVVQGEPDHKYEKAKSDHVWIQGMDVGMNVKALFNDLPVTGNLGLEMKVCNDNSAYPGDLGLSRRLNFYPYLSRADVAYTWGDKDNPRMVLDAGYFGFKYNNDSRNLGEYLFRSGTYPQYIITDFDFPMARLLGAHLSGSALSDKLTWDVLLTTNIEWTAIGDPNLSALVSYKPIPLLELGLGASWCSIWSVNWDNTSPRVSSGSAYVVDSQRYYYTFAGQKVMGRFTLDLQSLIKSDLFGKQDLKLYSEAAVLGLIDYPLSYDSMTRYDSILQRIPVMVGFNFPAFKFLDFLSVEAEWFGNPYPNTLSPLVFDNQPIPLSSYGNEKIAKNLNNHFDDIKWSVYGKRTFAEHFNVTFQFARDHMRWFRLNYSQQDWMEALRRTNEWYYTLKLGYIF